MAVAKCLREDQSRAEEAWRRSPVCRCQLAGQPTGGSEKHHRGARHNFWQDRQKRSASNGPGEAEEIEEEVEEEAEMEEDEAAEPDKDEGGEAEEEEEGCKETSAQSAASAEGSQSDASSDEEEASEGSIVTVVGDVLDDTAESVAAEEDENDGAAGALNREYIAQHFKDIRNFKAKDDFMVEDVNLTVLFCKVRSTLYQKPEIEKAKKSLWRRIIENEIQRFNYQGNSIGLSSTPKDIMMQWYAADTAIVGIAVGLDDESLQQVARRYMALLVDINRSALPDLAAAPLFADTRALAASKSVVMHGLLQHYWPFKLPKEAAPNLFVHSIAGSLFSDTAAAAAAHESEADTEFAAMPVGDPMAIDLLHAKKTAEFNLTDVSFLARYRALQVCRGFAFAVNEQERRSSSKLAEDEDTGVHLWLHHLLVETFRGCDSVIMWANGESSSSKAHRAPWAKSSKKPDFRVVYKDRENDFGEFKPYQIGSQRLPRQARDFALVVGAFELLWSIRIIGESDSDMGTASIYSSIEKTMPCHPTHWVVKQDAVLTSCRAICVTPGQS
ncbi:hypothetical protein HDU86_001358 [Geranomyces michiganensis]|nr:hypothetical protein HDU86_001358 [Geranomyces michiganensis]